MSATIKKNAPWLLLCLFIGFASLVPLFFKGEAQASVDGRAYWDVTVDLDEDGLPDDWEEFYFGSISARDGNEDDDLDSRDTWAEWNGGTDPLKLDPLSVAEVGEEIESQPDGEYWHKVRLDGVYNDPVVVMGPSRVENSFGSPLPIRVKDVKATSFDWQFDRFEDWGADWERGRHLLSWMVVEAGRHTFGELDGGQQIEVEAGNTSIPAIQATGLPVVVVGGWDASDNTEAAGLQFQGVGTSAVANSSYITASTGATNINSTNGNVTLATQGGAAVDVTFRVDLTGQESIVFDEFWFATQRGGSPSSNIIASSASYSTDGVNFTSGLTVSEVAEGGNQPNSAVGPFGNISSFRVPNGFGGNIGPRQSYRIKGLDSLGALSTGSLWVRFSIGASSNSSANNLTLINDRYDLDTPGMALAAANASATDDGLDVLWTGTIVPSVQDASQRITFTDEFATEPVVLAQVVSRNGLRATIAQVWNVDETGFNLFLQGQETLSYHDQIESVSWIAMESGYIRNEFGRRQVGSLSNVTNSWTELTFPYRFYNRPTFLASTNSINELDPAILRFQNLGEQRVDLRLIEERSFDPEVVHAAETVGWFATNVKGLVHVLPTPGDLDADGLPDAWEVTNNLVNGVIDRVEGYYGDVDGDGLLNWEEYRAGTRADLADTDGDGTNDGNEVNFYESDALAADVDEFSFVSSLSGSQYVDSWGVWRVEGTSALIGNPRGTLDFDISVLNEGVHSIEVNFSEITGATQNGTHQFASWLNGDYLGRRVVSSSSSPSFTLLTPWLNAGTHRFTVLWDNTKFDRRIAIDTIDLYSAEGVDSNNDGNPDWTEIRTRRQNGLSTYEELSSGHMQMPQAFQKYWKMQRQWADANRDWVTIGRNPNSRSHEFAWLGSKTSPACIEGKARYPGLTTTDGPVPLTLLPNDKWYLDLPLDAEVPVTQTFSFEGDHFAETLSVFWTPTNLAEETELLIREGDSLLLTAWTGNNPNASRKADIWIDDVLYPQIRYDQPLEHLFSQAGLVEIRWGLRQNPNSSNYAWEGTVYVDVAERPFLETIKCAVGHERPWEVLNLHPSALVQIDDDVAVFDGTELGSGSWSYALAVADTDPQPVAIRLGYTGPVLTTTVVTGINSASNLDTGIYQTQQFGDGTKLVEMPVFLSGDLSDISIEVRIYRAGVTYLDGSTTRTLTATDFDEFGFAILRYLVPAGVDANCHSIRIFQDGVQVAYYN